VCHGDMSDEGTCKLVTGRAMTNWSAARWRRMRAPRAASCSRRSRTRTSALGLAGLAPQRCDRLVRGPVRYRHHGPGDGDDATSQQHPSIHPSSILGAAFLAQHSSQQHSWRRTSWSIAGKKTDEARYFVLVVHRRLVEDHQWPSRAFLGSFVFFLYSILFRAIFRKGLCLGLEYRMQI